MGERVGLVTMKGNPLTLVGDEVTVGQKAPDFVAIDHNLSPVKFSSFRGKICILASVPSLDTPVCAIETRKFNEEASRLSADIVILRPDLRLVPRTLELTKKTFQVIRQNLFWAFFYNIVVLPLAIAGLLHPIVAAGAMAFSSLTVVGNSLRARVR